MKAVRVVTLISAGVAAALPFAGTPAFAHSPNTPAAKDGASKVAWQPGGVPARVKQVVGEKAEPAPNGLYRLGLRDGTALLTHGPDPKPDPTKDVLPNHGTGMEIGDPERPPICATDYYQQVLYAHVSGTTSHYGTAKPVIQATMRRTNYVLNEDSIASGGPTADYKVLCDVDGIRVDQLTTSGSSFNNVVNSARGAGYDDTNADYTIFLDSSSANACGVGSYEDDETPGASNASNLGGGYAVVYQGCWNDETAMHENGHNQGAVQYNAPHSTGSGAHCWDEEDVMCYSPDGDKHQGGTQLLCSDAIHYDCLWDTYFDSAPENGEYLNTHWNIGSPVNRFIVFGGAGGGGNQAPVASFTYDCSGLACQFTDASTDADGTVDSHTWGFDDGGSSTATNPSHAYGAPGTYDVSLQVIDNDGAANSVTIPVTVEDGSGTFALTNGVPANVQAGAEGSFDRYSIHVPGRQYKLTVVTHGEDCDRVGDTCVPDLDLYVRRGDQPTETEHDCRPYLYGISEKCTFRYPRKGDWYIGVQNFDAPTGTEYTVKATYRR